MLLTYSEVFQVNDVHVQSDKSENTTSLHFDLCTYKYLIIDWKLLMVDRKYYHCINKKLRIDLQFILELDT